MQINPQGRLLPIPPLQIVHFQLALIPQNFITITQKKAFFRGHNANKRHCLAILRTRTLRPSDAGAHPRSFSDESD